MLRIFYIAVIQRSVINRAGCFRVLISHIKIRGNPLYGIIIFPAYFRFLIHPYRTESRHFLHIIRGYGLLHQNISRRIPQNKKEFFSRGFIQKIYPDAFQTVVLRDKHLFNHVFLCNCFRLHGHLPAAPGNDFLRHKPERPQCNDHAETYDPDRSANRLSAVNNFIHSP